MFGKAKIIDLISSSSLRKRRVWMTPSTPKLFTLVSKMLCSSRAVRTSRILCSFSSEFAEAGVVIDARVYTYGIAIAQKMKEKRVEPAQK